MGKVVTSQDLVAGTVQTVPNHKPAAKTEAPKLETTPAAPTLEVKPASEALPAEPAAKVETEEAIELTEEEKALPEKAQKELQRAKRAVNKKHAELMQAIEDAKADERLAEQQYNERRLAEQRLEAAETRLRELEAQAQTAPVEPVKPTIDDKNADGTFKYRAADGQVDWDKYTDAKAEFAADQKFKEREARAAKEAAEAADRARMAQIKANADVVRQEHPDFDAVMRGIAGTEADRVPQFVLNYIYESENAAGVAYFLAKNPAESQRIAKLKPITAIRELGKIEDSLVKPSKAAIDPPAAQGATSKPGAPPPITPLSGSGNGAINTDPSKMDFKQLRAYERARARSKH
jgi:chemotaxis protein histidine kinase CheA